MSEVWLCRKDAATYLTSIGCPISAGTLEQLAKNENQGNGPRFLRMRWRTVRYNKEDLDSWAKRQGKWVE